MAESCKSRLVDKYKNEVVPALMEEFKYKSVMQVPKIEKIVLNTGVGEGATNSKALDNVVYGIRQISGQKPVITRAKKAIAGFKLRAGMPIGVKVSLRRDRMYHFLDRLISIALPRVRDFRGLPKKAFDGNGNYTFGLKEQTAFPEVDLDKLDKIRGMDITIVTTAKKDEEARSLLMKMGLPIRK